MESRKTYFFAAFLAPLIWGFMSIPVRWLEGWPADDILNYRILTGLIILWSYLLIFRTKVLYKDIQHYNTLSFNGKRRVVVLTVFASICIFGNWYCYIYAINYISVQSAAFGYMICPLITTFTAFVVLQERLNAWKWTALALALVSVSLLASGSLIDGMWSLAIAALYAFYLISQRVLQGFDKLHVLAIQLSICSLFIIPILIIQRHPLPQGYVFWTSILLIAVAFTIIPLFLSMYALTRISSSTTGVLLYVNPIIAFLLAIFYFKEDVDPHKYVAYATLSLAIVLFNFQTLRKLLTR
ncbi:EamA family transporter [Sphingobacterium griseoflavum]|nr:EamA family transporter [Sphingobacterium griseoflavum]